jgi:ribonuclease HI
MLHQIVVEIYTDGSCHTQYTIGAWAAILLASSEKIILKGEAQDTTHNRMELLAVINAIEFADEKFKNASLVVYTDSQYVERIPERKEKLKKNNFLTKKGTPLQNYDLVQQLICQIESHTIEFVKVKAHQRPEAGSLNAQINYNSEVDILARQIVRDAVIKSYQELPEILMA